MATNMPGQDWANETLWTDEVEHLKEYSEEISQLKNVAGLRSQSCRTILVVRLRLQDRCEWNTDNIDQILQ